MQKTCETHINNRNTNKRKNKQQFDEKHPQSTLKKPENTGAGTTPMEVAAVKRRTFVRFESKNLEPTNPNTTNSKFEPAISNKFGEDTFREPPPLRKQII